ncbi:MAG TPA: hypothetical protein VGT61_01415 [Thermomicrobiales bacterium]|nr:hypothetical protein [Thermomicrobiales bacterium]
MDSKTLFADVVSTMLTETNGPGHVEPPVPGARGFGAEAIRVDGKIFSMLCVGKLVVKLPQDWVEAMVASGAGAPFRLGRSRTMRGWVMVDVDGGEWVELSREARTWVASLT